MEDRPDDRGGRVSSATVGGVGQRTPAAPWGSTDKRSDPLIYGHK
jgi:hypothetical protein